MIRLGVNIDHIATVRQARRGQEPDPLWAAVEAQLGGADGITVHLREDRRHIQDQDVIRLKGQLQVKLNLEMAATPEMLDFALKLKPDLVMLVPEGRQEVTTEGGLDVCASFESLRPYIDALRAQGILSSAFIAAESRQIEAAQALGIAVCEIHSGPYAHCVAEHGYDFEHGAVQAELEKIRNAGAMLRAMGMRFNAGHGLNYVNVQPLAALPGISELHIGHALISRALFVGMRAAVVEMKRLMREAAHRL